MSRSNAGFGSSSERAPLLVRIRATFVLLNVLMGVLAVIELSYPDAPGWPASAVRTAAFVGLAAWALLHHVRAGSWRFLHLVPLPLLVAGGLAAGSTNPMFGRLYVALFLQALTLVGGWRSTLVLASGYVVAYETVAYVTADAGREPAQTVSTVLAVGVVTWVMRMLAVAVKSHERLTARNATLTDVVANLLAERDRAHIGALVAEGALRLVETAGAVVTVWRREDERLHRVGLAGASSYPLATVDLADLPHDVRDVFLGVRTELVDVPHPGGSRSRYPTPPPRGPGLVAAIPGDGGPSGLIVIASTEPLDSDLRRSMQRFVYEVSMAQQLAERDALLTSVVANSSDVIAVVDEKATFTYISPALRTLTGHDPADHLGARIGTLLAHEDGAPLDRLDSLNMLVPTLLRLAGSGAELPVEVTTSQLDEGAWVLNVRDVSERSRLEAEVTYRAFHDTVTDLPNRALFVDRLERALRVHAGDRGMVAAALVDIDDFKAVNDSLGHAAGDQLLVDAAARIRETVPKADTVARLGEDEFALLLRGPHVDAEVSDVVVRLLAALRRPFLLGGSEVSVTVSVGVAVIDDGMIRADEVLRNADVALYSAKSSGKGQHAVFAPHMQDASLTRHYLSQELDRALTEAELVVHYQPIVVLATGAIVGVEALLRWDHPTRGLVGPEEFVPVAEELGLIVPIGTWVLREACAQAAAWQRVRPADTTPLHVSVNISAVQLRDAGVVDAVASALERSGLTPARLTLEMTETAFGDPEEVRVVLNDLKALGVKVAIDDFGTGYSSLLQLQRLSVDMIKIDRAFVSVITDGPEQSAVARATVKLAETLELGTVAEGVESPGQSSLLQQWGCTYGQGWLWSAALPAPAMSELLADPRPLPRRPPAGAWAIGPGGAGEVLTDPQRSASDG